MGILLKNATLLDGNGGTPLKQHAVLVQGDKIAAVATPNEAADLEQGHDIVDLTGKFLLPGLINTHDHVTNKRIRGTRAEKARMPVEALVGMGVQNVLLNLREGITTIRDMGARNGISKVVKSVLESKMIFGSRLVVVLRSITVTAGYSHLTNIEADSPLEARKAAGQLIKDGCDWVKCMASVEWERGLDEPISAVNMETELMKAAFDMAHHHGKPCTVHAVCDESIANALEAGVDAVEHGIMMSKRTAKDMARRNVFLVPTLSGYLEHCNDWGRGEGVMRHGRLLQQYHGPAFRNALEAGVRYTFGTDTLGNFVDEAKAMRAAGATPMDCVVAATKRGAELLRLADEIGTVEKGKLADLVVLNKNPLETPEAFGDVFRVMKSGRMFDPAQLPI